MSWKDKVLVFFSNFSLGMIVPIFSLVLCSHGCSAQSVGTAMLFFGLTVMLVEIPSGIFADLYGRKFSFLLSCVLGSVWALILLWADSFPAAVLVLVFRGLSAAFSSGSLDALVVDKVLKEKGSRGLEEAVASLQMFQCIGIAGGSLTAGWIPYSEGYSVHLLVLAAFYLLTALLGLSLPSERKGCESRQGCAGEERAKAEKSASGSGRISLRGHLRVMRRLFADRPAIRSVVHCMVLAATVQFVLEIYWQPRLAEIIGAGRQAVFGILGAAAYLATTFGCFLMGKAKPESGKSRWGMYLSLCLGFAGMTAALSLAGSLFGFSSGYLVIYLLLGMLSVSEQTIINGEVPGQVRASMLSVSSFASRSGGMLSSAASSALMLAGDIGFVWRVTALAAAGGLGLVIMLRSKSG
ncbi:MAG: MFS transporter [Lachnospiraceae bacterium]|nr:MFS transporter [Lachnospiraceae bacterium]